MSAPTDPGRIITFYSYKGGTGRSMALANVAWILASHGQRVLVIDWDLEAPGLHRYFHPFLEDPELTASPGLIDFVCEFAEAARLAKRASSAEESPTTGDSWHAPYTSLLRYTYSLEGEFGDGTLDFVPAGQQGPGYALRVNGFDWREFYEQLGGGVLLEGLKKRLREDYDFVLIDSRTGISDTSGVCTVQMPDELVVLFTLNQQSIKGAAAVAESASAQRRRPSGEPALKVWPVATRVELAEKERLDAARRSARTTFQGHLRHLPRRDREEYWGETEVLYQPYFAYEEILAVFVEQRRQRSSMLGSFEALTSYLSHGSITTVGEINAEDRERAAASLRRATVVASAAAPAAKKTMVVFPREDYHSTAELVRVLIDKLGPEVIWWEADEILPGDNWDEALHNAFDSAGSLLACFGPGWVKRRTTGMFERQLTNALERQMRVIPVVLDGLDLGEWLQAVEVHETLHPLSRLNAVRILPTHVTDGANLLAEALVRLRARTASTPPPGLAVDLEDPQKGQWGGKNADRDRSLDAGVRELSPGWFEIVLTVKGTARKPLVGPVTFHLHPTFKPPVRDVSPVDGAASLTLAGWGAFTVGVETDDGKTRLELDLSQESSLPQLFRDR